MKMITRKIELSTEIDVMFTDPTKATEYFNSGEWAEMFLTHDDDMDKLANDLGITFHQIQETHSDENIDRFVEGVHPFISARRRGYLDITFRLTLR
jgi:hypothetical protein